MVPMSPEELDTRRFVVIGGGPAGLTAAYELTKLGLCPIVLEKERDRGRSRPHRELQGLPLRHGRPPLLHQGRRR